MPAENTKQRNPIADHYEIFAVLAKSFTEAKIVEFIENYVKELEALDETAIKNRVGSSFLTSLIFSAYSLALPRERSKLQQKTDLPLKGYSRKF